MKTRRDKLDDVFSRLIRLRDGGTCQRCGAHESQKKIDCSHFWSRRHQATRYDPDNACAHCFTCHQYLGENPVEFATWIENYLGFGRYQMLTEKHRQIVKRTKREKEELYAHLKSELRKLELAHANGVELPSVVGFD